MRLPNQSCVVRASRVSMAMGACAALGAGSDAGVSLNLAQWEWDQGGYAQQDLSHLTVVQNVYSNSLPSNTVTATLGGAFFRSSTAMGYASSQTSAISEFTWTAVMDVEASVEPGWPEGEAQAYASVWYFAAGFTVVTDSYLYTGATPLTDDLTFQVYFMGDTIGPGTYSYFGFQELFTQTALVGEGESDHGINSGQFNFRFELVPAPGATGALLIPLGALVARRRR